MVKKDLYRYTGRNGFITSLILLEGIEHIAMYRLFADSDKLLTNGEMTTEAVDIFADELNNWKEINKPEDNNN